MAVQLSTSAGGVIADATDSFDMMDKLIDFITGVTAGETGKELPVGERWVVNKDDSVTIAGERHVYLQGPGLSGTDAIYVVVRIYSDAPNNLHNWEIKGATGFSDGLAYDEQPGGSTVYSYLTLSNANMPFWFVVSGRRIILVAQTAGSVTYAAYLGWYLPYATPSEFPYPMFCGGSTCSSTYNYLQTNYQVGNFYDGPNGASVAKRLTDAAAHVRHRDGSWLTCSAYYQTSGASRPSSYASQCFVWPHDEVNASQYEYKMVQSVGDEFAVFPFILYSTDNGGNIYGELDGIFFSPLGTVGKKFPDTITIATKVYLVINNTYRTSEANAALLLE